MKLYLVKLETPETPPVPEDKVYYEKLFDFDAYAEAAKYTGPVLIVHGDADRTVDLSYGRAAAENYQNARIEVLPGEDHGFSGKGKLKAAELVYEFLVDNCD